MGEVKDEFDIVGGKSVEVELAGFIEYPLLDPIDPGFSGSIEFNAELEKLLEARINQTVPIGGVPVPLTGSLDVNVGMENTLSLSGLLTEPEYEGVIEPKVTFKVFGGIGQDYGDAALKAGLYLDGIPSFPLIFENTLRPRFEPYIELNMGLRSSAKIFDNEAEYSYNIFKVVGDKNGWSGDVYDGSISLEADGTFGEIELSSVEESSDWEVMDRYYLLNGSGFCANDETISLFDIHTTNKNERLMYNNITPSSEMRLVYVNGKKY